MGPSFDATQLESILRVKCAPGTGNINTQTMTARSIFAIALNADKHTMKDIAN